MYKPLPLLLLLLLFPITLLAQLSSDGPYIWHDSIGTGARIVSVSPEGQLLDQHVASLPKDYSFPVRTEDGQHQFTVQLHDVTRPSALCDEAPQTFVMSDPHGNFDCFQSLLKAGGVIGDDYHWRFGKGHLAILGDVMDRGVDVTPIFWLIYQLEAEAAAAGGRVSFLLGNHETLVLMNDVRYTEKKYLALADTLSMSCAQLYGPRTELGHWLQTRNALMRTGRNLFVHAGLSPQFYELNMTIDSLNTVITSGLYKTKKERKEFSDLVYTLFASDGPIWYRGLVREDEKFHPATPDSLQLILDRYEADHLFVGHTIFPEVTRFYDGKVIGVNVDNKKARQERRTRGVLICGDEMIFVSDEGLTGNHFSSVNNIELKMTENLTNHDYMQMAIEEARQGIRQGHGGPFGTVIVKDGKIIAKGHNMVLANNDATAHGEMMAIRAAGAALGTYDLSGCTLYTTGEPCHMCLCAILWANIDKVFYGCTIADNGRIGFRDDKFNDLFGGRDKLGDFLVETDRDSCLLLFDEYNQMQHNTY